MLDVHRPYPGVALVVTDRGSILFGAPADAFKATKRYCAQHGLPFPRVLVAPRRLVAHANPQFAPEFFLYDFLFVYGAAFKPELEHERLALVLDVDQVEEEKRALAITLDGPTLAELEGWRDAGRKPLVDARTAAMLAGVSEHMAIKKDGRRRRIDEMIDTPTFDSGGAVDLLDARVRVQRTGAASFHVRSPGGEAAIDLSFEPPVVPFATLPPPAHPPTPATFGMLALGTRSGFDLSGPTTGFLLWLNGQAVIYDGPVGTRYILGRHGIAASDVGAIVLSHCHEDHMGAFVELILGGHRPRLYTAEPVYRSMLVKLAHHFRLKEEEVAGFIDYERVTPGVPVEVFGATLDFFYTVHAIPTIGMAVSLRAGDGVTRRVQISGDTLGHEGLDRLLAEGVLDDETHARMRHLVPAEKVDGAMYLADVGEAMIHGHPKDWQGNPNRVLYYHCPDDERTRGFGHEVANAGASFTFVDAPRFHPAVPGRLLRALAFLDFDDPEWLATFLHRGRMRRAAAGEVLVRADEIGDTLAVVVSGAAEVLGAFDGAVIAELGPGEAFGAIELVDADRRLRAGVRALTPMELFEIDGALVHAYVQARRLDGRLARAWANRPGVESARLFRTLDAPTRSRIAALGIEERFAAGAIVFSQGAAAEDFYLLVEGRVAVQVDGTTMREIAASDDDNFFGEITAVYPNRRRSATVRAATPVRALRLSGAALRRLFEGEMAVRYALLVAIEQRGG